ncbi:hypothetical protein SAMN05428969_3413 [Devosia sp. YR412]|nr:hypothetical protein SAMN05428969_3413 [Devosia sp. YR412]
MLSVKDGKGLARLGDDLFKRMPEAAVVPGIKVSTTDGRWQPLPNECHTNAAFWVRDNPGAEAVGGSWSSTLKVTPTMLFSTPNRTETPR